MAASRAANVAEMAVGHGGNATVTTDVSNYSKEGYGEETGAMIKATTWQGKNSVKVGMYQGACLGYDGQLLIHIPS